MPDPSDPEQQRQRRRVRTRTGRRSRRAPSRHRWWWLPVVASLLILFAVTGTLFLRDAQVTRTALLEAQASLEEVRGALGDVDVDEANRALDAADERLGVARSRVSGPLWSVVGVVPILGDSVEVVRAVVDVGTVGLEVAQVAVDDGQDLVARGIGVDVSDGQLDLEPLLQARQVIADLPFQRLLAARDRLEAAEPRWAPGQVHAGRADTLDFVGDTIDAIERADALLDVLPGFLGDVGPRRYFLGVQTPGELRGTGGLIGYWAVLNVDEGRFSLSEAGVYEALDDVEGAPADEQEAADATTSRIGDLRGDPWDGVPTTPEFRERYAHTAASGFFSNVNVDPDLPTTARVALDLFTKRTGEQLDGMILLDPIAMELILEAVGQPLEFPPGIDDPALPQQLAPDEFARFALIDVYEDFGQGRSDIRKPLLRGIGDRAFALVFDGAWDGVAMSQAVSEAVATRHLQVFSEFPEEQAAFSQVGVTGELAHDGGDLLAVTANNAVGGKQDVHLGHEVSAQVTLAHPRPGPDDGLVVDRDQKIRITVDNPLPSQGMDTYIIGNCLVGDDRNRCFDGPPGWNRTWFSVWAPGGDALQSGSGPDGMAAIRTGTFRDLRVFDHYLETSPESRGWFELQLAGDVEVARDGDMLVYRLTWVRQSKAIPDLLDVTVSPPAGWQAVDVQVLGGGDGTGMGVHGAGVPLETTVSDDGTAAVAGTVNAVATIEVRLQAIPE